jgi:hypothetical protein
MQPINHRKLLALAGLLTVTLAAGCAGAQGGSNNDGYSAGGWGSSYPNLNSSGGPYPSNGIYGSDVPNDSNHAYVSDVNHGNPPSHGGSETYARVNANADRDQAPHADRRADQSNDRSASAER